MNFLLKKVIVYLAILIAVWYGYRRLMDLPVTCVAFVEPTLKKGPPSLLGIVLSKVVDSRRELTGNDPYKVYAFAGDKDRLESVSFTHNGQPVPFRIDPETDNSSVEIDGNTEPGLHTYVLKARDTRGHESVARLIINIRLVPIVPVGGVM
mgnify:CR=1 FL=1